MLNLGFLSYCLFCLFFSKDVFCLLKGLGAVSAFLAETGWSTSLVFCKVVSSENFVVFYLCQFTLALEVIEFCHMTLEITRLFFCQFFRILGKSVLYKYGLKFKCLGFYNGFRGVILIHYYYSFINHTILILCT